MNSKNIVITGSSSGFGLLSAISLAREGHRVFATMRDIKKGEELLYEAKKNEVSHNIEILSLDVTNPEEVQRTVNNIINKVGKIDVLINNAGIVTGGALEEVSLDMWRKQFETNVFGMATVTKEVVPFMRALNSGRIINISSMAGYIGVPGLGAYCSSKFAVEGFSEALRHELHEFGVEVSVVEPGPYQTNLWSNGLNNVEKKILSSYEIPNYIEKEAKKKEGISNNPTEVVEVINKIVKSKKPKFRYPVGKNVRLNLFLKNILPWSIIEKVVQKEINKGK